MRRALLAAAVAALAVAPAASPSQLIGRNVRDVTLRVNGAGEALLTYRAQGAVRRVLVWGAVNAVAPSERRRQVRFSVDYSGGWRTHGRALWRRFGDTCAPYDGPRLQWLVTACRAGDGSYWAVQRWRRGLPSYGRRADARQRAWELRVSHWQGELPSLVVKVNWAYRRYHHLYGRLTYRGKGVYGFRTTRRGAPLDTHGRNIYVDTLDSAYGRGWRRENGFVTHRPGGTFCYGFYPHGRRPAGSGIRYRATVIGPGVTPDLLWVGRAPGAFDAATDAAANAELRSWGDRLCRGN